MVFRGECAVSSLCGASCWGRGLCCDSSLRPLWVCRWKRIGSERIQVILMMMILHVCVHIPRACGTAGLSGVPDASGGAARRAGPDPGSSDGTLFPWERGSF